MGVVPGLGSAGLKKVKLDFFESVAKDGGLPPELRGLTDTVGMARYQAACVFWDWSRSNSPEFAQASARLMPHERLSWPAEKHSGTCFSEDNPEKFAAPVRPWKGYVPADRPARPAKPGASDKFATAVKPWSDRASIRPEDNVPFVWKEYADSRKWLGSLPPTTRWNCATSALCGCGQAWASCKECTSLGRDTAPDARYIP